MPDPASAFRSASAGFFLWSERLPGCLDRHGGAYRWIVLAFFAGLILVIALTVGSYGFSIDEALGQRRAERIYAALFDWRTQGAKQTRFENSNLYGAMPDFLGLLLEKAVPGLSVYARHVVSAFFGLVGIFYVHRIGAVFVNRWTALLAPIFLTCNTLWFGYMFFNLKDIPFAALLIAGFYYCMLAVVQERPSRSVWVGIAASVGLLSTTKLLGVAMLGFCCFVALAAYLAAPPPHGVRLDRALLVRIAGVVVATCVGCALCLWIFWPQFYVFDMSQRMAALSRFMNYDVWQGTLLIHGDQFKAIAPPYYMLVYLLISVPLFLVLLPLLSPYVLFRKPHPMALTCAIVVVSFILYQAATGARVYNGAKHFLFLAPFGAILAAYVAAYLLEAPRAPFRGLALAGIALCVWAAMVSMLRLFPYQYSYYNSLVGGVAGANGLYYIDIWRTAATEAMARLEAKARLEDRKIKVSSCATRMNFELFPSLIHTRNEAQAEYIVSSRRRCDAQNYKEWKQVDEVTRQGVIFSTTHYNPSAAPIVPESQETTEG